MPTFGSLFAGIGGIDLGLERAGWTCRWQVEWDEWCQRVLAKHWPDVPRYGDIATVDWSGVERVDLLAGGFPCQPVSAAGKRKAQADERWLWPEFLRAIRALRPRLVLVENVTNLLAIDGGSAFGEVVGDLAASGYDAEWDCIPASAVGALHERDRVWIVAYPRRLGGERWGVFDRLDLAPGTGASEASERQWLRDAAGDRGTPLADATGNGRQPRRQGDAAQEPGRREPHRGAVGTILADADPEGLEGRSVHAERASEWAAWPGGMADPDGSAVEPWRGRRGARETGGWWWRTEPMVDRLVDGLPRGLARWRVAALQGLGNAVVPQVVEVIGRQLLSQGGNP